MTIEENDPRLTFVPIEKATVPPPGLIRHLKDHWWCVHPEKGLIFWKSRPRDEGSPQCNSNEACTRHHVKEMYPWAEARFIPSVFHRIDPNDYV